jgi:hypothetical protein
MSAAARVRLVHWNRDEAEERAGVLRALGFEVASDLPEAPALLRALSDEPPDAVVVDLSRTPSHGRDLALAIRTRKATRGVPLVFVGGEAEKVARVRELLPDATFTSWEEIAAILPLALAAPPADPVVPSSALAGYSGTPLPRKLGIAAGTALALLAAPSEVATILGELPAGVAVTESLSSETSLAIWFVRSRRDLDDGVARVAAALGDARLWIAWPKKTSALAGDAGEREVRAAGLAHGLVDFKVCAIDATWSGLCFTRRRAGS